MPVSVPHVPSGQQPDINNGTRTIRRSNDELVFIYCQIVISCFITCLVNVSGWCWARDATWKKKKCCCKWQISWGVGHMFDPVKVRTNCLWWGRWIIWWRWEGIRDDFLPGCRSVVGYICRSLFREPGDINKRTTGSASCGEGSPDVVHFEHICQAAVWICPWFWSAGHIWQVRPTPLCSPTCSCQPFVHKIVSNDAQRILLLGWETIWFKSCLVFFIFYILRPSGKLINFKISAWERCECWIRRTQPLSAAPQPEWARLEPAVSPAAACSPALLCKASKSLTEIRWTQLLKKATGMQETLDSNQWQQPRCLQLFFFSQWFLVCPLELPGWARHCF